MTTQSFLPDCLDDLFSRVPPNVPLIEDYDKPDEQDKDQQDE